MGTVKLAAGCVALAVCAGYAAKADLLDFGVMAPASGPKAVGSSPDHWQESAAPPISAVVAAPEPVMVEESFAVRIDDAEKKLAEVDELMRDGTFALYGPDEMIVEQANTIALDIAGREGLTLGETIDSSANGEALTLLGGAQDFEWFPEMSAKLTGADFTIEPAGPVYVRIRDGALARDISWQVTPTKTGERLPLKLTLLPDFSILGDDAPRARDFTTTKTVTVKARPMIQRLADMAEEKGPDWIVAGGTGLLAFFGSLLAGRVRRAFGGKDKSKE